MRRLLLSSVCALGALATPSCVASAADWQPAGQIKLMIGFTAGGGADTQARLIAEDLENRLGWKLVPEQVKGKGGTALAANAQRTA